MASTILARFDVLKDNIETLFYSLDNFLFWFRNQCLVIAEDNRNNAILKLQRFCSIYNFLFSELCFWNNGSTISNLHSACIKENCEGTEWYFCIDAILEMYQSEEISNLAPILQATFTEKKQYLRTFSTRCNDYCLKLEECYLGLKERFPNARFVENSNIQREFKFRSFSIQDEEIHDIDMNGDNFSSREKFAKYLAALIKTAESTLNSEPLTLENLAIVALSGKEGTSIQVQGPDSEAEFEEEINVSNTSSIIFVSKSFSENEKHLEDIIVNQLEIEEKRKESNIRLIFEMLALYSKEGYSFQSFLLMLENATIRFKTSSVEKLNLKTWYQKLNASRQRAAKKKVWENAKDFIYRVGSDMYSFLRDFATLKKERRLNSIYEKYPEMPSDINLFELAPLIEKVYKEDYLVLSCSQKGFWAIKNRIVDLVTNEQTISLFKSGECEKAYDKVFQQIQANNARSFKITDEKKAVLKNILSEYTSAENPFPYDLRKTNKPEGSYRETPSYSQTTKKRNQTVVSVDALPITEINSEEKLAKQPDHLPDPAVAFSEISGAISSEKKQKISKKKRRQGLRTRTLKKLSLQLSNHRSQ